MSHPGLAAVFHRKARRNPINHAQGYRGWGGGDFGSAASHVVRAAGLVGWMVAVQAASSGRVEQSVLRNFPSGGIGCRGGSAQ